MGFKINQADVTGLILAGGRGSRVGGQDKGLLEYKGKPIVAHQIAWLKPQLDTILISANRNLDVYAKYDCEVFNDKVEGFEGPLHGILQGLLNCQTEWLFVLPVDVPHLPHDLVGRLLNRIKEERKGYYLVTDERQHYLNMLVNRSALEKLAGRINNNQNRVRDFLSELNAEAINLDIPEKYFSNLNCLENYR